MPDRRAAARRPPASPYYAYYPDDDATFQAFYFHSTDPAIRESATLQQEPDPCGNGGSLAQTLLVDQQLLGDIEGPVLLVYGMHDGYRPQPDSGEQHAEKFIGSASVTLRFIDEAGNALPLERNAAQFRSTVAAWLCDQGLTAEHACRPDPSRSRSPAQRPDTAAVQDRVSLPSTGTDPTLAWVPLIGIGVLLIRRSH